MGNPSKRLKFMKDTSIRFSLENTAIRGVIAVLEDSAQEALSHAAYSDGVATLMKQLLAATAAIGSLTRFDGTMTLQARSETGINLVMAERKETGSLRSIAKGHEQTLGSTINELLPDGLLAITLDPTVGQRYQGIIPLESNDLAVGLSDYFAQSEQLRTNITLLPTANGIAAIILQAMPATELNQCTDEDWETVKMLVDTLKAEEIQSLEGNEVLYRLFHEFGVRVFEQDDITYKCGCSKEKMGEALATLDPKELLDILEQDGKLQLNCDFCNTSHDFYLQDLQKLFVNLPNLNNSDTVKKLH